MDNAIGTLRQWILRHSGLLLTFGIFSIALLLRLYRLDAQSLWLDEGGTWAEVTGRTGKGWLALISELVSLDAGYPLYHLLLKAWVSVAGDSEWALRFPSALAGALAVVVVVLAGAELRENREPRTENRELRTTELPNYGTENQEPRTKRYFCPS